MSIYNAAAMAATLDLPLNNNLGFAYIVPYHNNNTNQTLAQFQLGYKGFIQLAQRSGQIKTISVSEIYEGQLIEENPLKGFVFDFTKKTSDVVIGYAAFFQQLNGFEKTLYMTKGEAEKHGKRYSQTFKKGFGLWSTDFDAMAKKTVLKLLLAGYAPLSIEMQKAIITDQSIINDAETMDTTYIDNQPLKIESKSQEQHESERIIALIEDAETLEQLELFRNEIKEDQTEFFAAKYAALSDKKGKSGKQGQTKVAL
jgi:recombination protein RecT